MIIYTCDICGMSYKTIYQMGRIRYQHLNKREDLISDSDACTYCKQEISKATEEAKERIKRKKHETSIN